MDFTTYFKERLKSTTDVVIANKGKLFFFMIVAMLLQFQTHSFEYKARISGTAQDIAESVASAPIFLTVEMLLGVVIFTKITSNMKRSVCQRHTLTGSTGSALYTLFFLVFNLTVSLFFIILMFTLVTDGSTQLNDPEQAKDVSRLIMYTLPFVMGVPYAASALSMRQFAINSVIKAYNPKVSKKTLKQYPLYKSSFVTLCSSWKQTFTDPYYLALCFTFVLLVSPEIYLPETMKGSLIAALVSALGHGLILVIYLAAYDDGMETFIKEAGNDNL
ncbi:hypothetical protein BM525_21670 (plasmid) [Alteromonas mediterranea]|uniref:Uncharacterized protein n=1 Tax=Alteromonas mediterranea TaxID=314275 RepID=A0AAC9JH70_9ALTE|nr:hypothetical protein [Alteromonas mediterranea]APD92471.1 hypothetical protein BM524_21450 [Alteromonas mediterranea]APE00332.1 hypothetical protein BM525_21670 [Alteromonas mediterranea]